MSDIDWNSGEDIVVKTQLGIAVFPNAKGTITIAQERSWDEDNDTLITVDPSNVDAVIEGLIKAKENLVG